MENQIKIRGQVSQKMSKATVQKPKKNQWMILTIFLGIVFLAGVGWLILNSKSKIFSTQTVVNGVIRTSGLSEEEKQKFGLTTVDYQITDFVDDQKAYDEDQIAGYFLRSNIVDDNLLGKCVQITGTTPEDWKDKANPYNRLALSVSNVEEIDNSNCNPYENEQIQPYTENNQKKIIFLGVVKQAERPAPDIGYDYQLKLSEPFVDEFNSAAESYQEVDFIDLVPTSKDLWIELENNMDKDVEVEGYMVWGYAESRYLQLTRLKTLPAQL